MHLTFHTVTWEILFIYALLAGVMLAFFFEWAPPDVIALSAFGAVLATGILGIDDALSVFSNPAPITIAAMFVLSAALEATGCIDVLGKFFTRVAGKSELRVMLTLMLLAGALSAFVNNTPVVVFFLPIVLSLARSTDLKSSRLLIPLSFAAILGGTCTLIGTSTNLIIDGIAQELGQPPFAMFEFTRLGVIYAAVGIAYIATIGRKLLPSHELYGDELETQVQRRFLTQFSVEKDSHLVGKPLTETLLAKLPDAQVFEVRRRGVPLETPLDALAIEADDRLLVTLHDRSLEELKAAGGLRLAGREHIDLKQLETRQLKMMEGIVGARSRLIGNTIRSLRLRQRYGVHILAIHREGADLRRDIGDVKLAFGDTLLLEGPVSGINSLQQETDFVTLTERAPPAVRKRRGWIAAAIVAAFVLSASAGMLPIASLAILAALATILSGCLDSKRAYQSIQWEIIFLIFGMLALGKAMETSQAAQFFVTAVTGVFEGATPYVLLAVVYLICTVLTEFITNNAVAALLAPILIPIAESLGVDARPFIVAMIFGCSASFATPIGYQTNTYVYGAGGYRFSDFVKIGLPLNVILWILATLLIPRLWPFYH